FPCPAAVPTPAKAMGGPGCVYLGVATASITSHVQHEAARVHHACWRNSSCLAARGARAAGGPCSDESLLLEAGGVRPPLPLSVIPNCAALALRQALWTFIRQLFRLFQLVPLQRPALLAPAIISALSYPDLTGRIGNAPTLRNQYVNLLQLRGNFFRSVSLPRHV